MKGPVFRLRLQMAAARAERKGDITADERDQFRRIVRKASDQDFEDMAEVVADEAVRAGVIPADKVPGRDAKERDWAAFFDALAAFLERILPLILSLFGGL